jgi:hypothetical protein
MMESIMNERGKYETALNPSDLLSALKGFSSGDFSVRLDSRLPGIDGDIASVFNKIVEYNSSLTKELDRVSIAIGVHGDFSERADIHAPQGQWQTYPIYVISIACLYFKDPETKRQTVHHI